MEVDTFDEADIHDMLRESIAKEHNLDVLEWLREHRGKRAPSLSKAIPMQVGKYIDSFFTLQAASASMETSPKTASGKPSAKPPPPPGEGWTAYVDEGFEWWHYEGPLGQWQWTEKGGVEPYEDEDVAQDGEDDDATRRTAVKREQCGKRRQGGDGGCLMRSFRQAKARSRWKAKVRKAKEQAVRKATELGKWKAEAVRLRSQVAALKEEQSAARTRALEEHSELKGQLEEAQQLLDQEKQRTKKLEESLNNMGNKLKQLQAQKELRDRCLEKQEELEVKCKRLEEGSKEQARALALEKAATSKLALAEAAAKKTIQDALVAQQLTADQLKAFKTKSSKLDEENKRLQREKEDLQAQLLQLQKAQESGSVQSTHDEGFNWQYEQDKGVWSAMGQDANAQLLSAYKKYLNSEELGQVSITSSGRMYTIDFTRMVQINPDTFKERSIKVNADVPRCWSTSPEALLQQDDLDTIYVDEHDPKVWEAIQRLLQDTAHGNGFFKGSRCAAMQGAKMKQLWRIENFMLWREYTDHLRRMKMLEGVVPIDDGSALLAKEDVDVFNSHTWEKLCTVEGGTELKAAGPPYYDSNRKWVPVKPDGDRGAWMVIPMGVVELRLMTNLGRSKAESTVRPCLGTISQHVEAHTYVLDEKFPSTTGANEQWLFHGTTYGKMQQIVQSGFDNRVARMGGLYGIGTYFASESCKAHQYTCEHCHPSVACTCADLRYIILARVAVGCPYYTDHVCKNLRRPPPRYGNRLHDCVVANPCKFMLGAPRSRQDHQEFVSFQAGQAYPCFVLSYSTAG